MYQLKEHGFKTYSNCWTATYCDDARDTYYIKLGAMAYDEDNKK